MCNWTFYSFDPPRAQGKCCVATPLAFSSEKASWESVAVVWLLSHVWLIETHGLQHTKLPCPSPSPRTCSNSCPLSQWCHPTILYSVVPFFSCLQSFNVIKMAMLPKFICRSHNIQIKMPVFFIYIHNTVIKCRWKIKNWEEPKPF